MQDFYQEHKRTSVFSWREFSKLAGFTSPNYMKVVCEGKSGMSKAGAERAALAMNLVGYEVEYFKAMVTFGDAKSEAAKKSAFEKMAAIAKENRVRALDADAFTYLESWKNPVVRELAPMMKGAKPLELARACYPEVTAMEVRETLDFLVKNNFLKKTGEDSFEQSEKAVSGISEVLQMGIRSMHREMGNLAVKSLELPINERNFGGVTMGISQKTYGRIVKELEECRRRIIAIANEDDEADQVYRVNLQMFPLTKNTRILKRGNDNENV